MGRECHFIIDLTIRLLYCNEWTIDAVGGLTYRVSGGDCWYIGRYRNRSDKSHLALTR
jgi:hypothetical protein